MKFKKFFGFLTLFAALSLNIGNNEKEKKINNNLFSEKQSLQQIEKKARVVFSYEDIFSNYYQKFSDSMLKNDIENPYTYDEYKNGFYTFNMNIDDYNDFLLSEAKGLINISDYETNTTSSSSYDADYILKGDISNPDSTDFNPNITPTTAFKRKVKYDKFNVYNNTNSSKNLMYNKKLAFESDAKNFNNLLDVESVNIPARLHVTVKISTNVFATDAAFCYQDLNNKKSITYAHSLNNSTLRCKIFKNIVE